MDKNYYLGIFSKNLHSQQNNILITTLNDYKDIN